MQFTTTGAVASVLLMVAAGGLAESFPRQELRWQADLQIRTLEVTRSRAGISVRVVVYTEHDDEARDVRLLVLLPVGVGIQRLAEGCAGSASPPMVPSLRATVTCELGSMTDRKFHEVNLTTTLPPDGTRRRLGVFAYSGTPDPVPGNNYAERAIP
jgi:hypothetical protein